METQHKKLPPIYIVSGGKGIAGEIMVQSTLIQFPDNRIPVVIVPDVITDEKLQAAVDQAKITGGIIVHTMVDTQMRNKLKQLCHEKGVKDIDMMGELSDYVSQLLGVEPVCVPGLYRKVNQQYFDRIASIEFTLSHDDGLNAHKIYDADVVLTGVSRVGKTPLSIYMAMFGWKVANIPIIPNMDPPSSLFEIDNRRVFGLTISADNLLDHRQKRAERYHRELGNYATYAQIEQELEYAMRIFRKGGFTVVDVTHKPIELTANEIIRMLIDRFPHYEQKRGGA
jgi:regulator of PEP synthase PpsR (kinase-PPPase family)